MCEAVGPMRVTAIVRGDETGTDRSEAVALAMADPAFYAHRPATVDRCESHISRVFIAGERVFKTKKAVVFPFLDYGTAQRRREMCHAEVRLNRRLTDDVYLGVRAIVERDGAFSLGEPDDPDAVEWAVEMRRLPLEHALDRRLAENRLPPGAIDAVARRLVEFHANAERAPAVAERISTLRRRIYRDIECLADSVAVGVDALALHAAERFTGAFLHARQHELVQRGASGLVRDGHGDLRLEHVLVGDDGVQVVDCVEFDPFLRETDVSEDLAYLVMELVDAGADAHAWEMVDAYRGAGGDPGDHPLVAFFAAYRALIRAKLAYLEPSVGGGHRGDAAARGVALMETAARLRWRARMPLVVVVCGGTGAGKSTLSAALGTASGLPVAATDATRKMLAGIAPDERAAQDCYDDEFSRRTYREVARTAAKAVVEHGGAIVDGTFRRLADRDGFRGGLEASCGAPVVFIECRAPREVLEARVGRRAATPGPSDAGRTLVAEHQEQFAALDEVAAADHAVLRSDRTVRAAVDAVEAWLDNRMAGQEDG